ncbi:MAG: caspase family protein [Rhodoferax sp.]|uniref:caspase family protein n=1 Tax=Rhodoferax sp. TaxID=50421 RepID=UPI00271D511D|nr:caspase family protein [Rhodoferax sp.]MDO8447989.1 caspase family protein [Rhodoferax sp.]
MGQVFGFLIAVEKYQDVGINAVRFAENDATGLRDALELHGLNMANTVLLLSAQATKNRIESEIRRVCKTVRDGDTLYFFYAGHGFSNNSKNYITCHDTVLKDLAPTSIELQGLFTELARSACRKIILFLDSCHSGLEIDDRMRSILSDLSDDDFRNFCQSAEHHQAFSACKPDEQSRSALYLKHGIWTYHLLEALNGRDKAALERGKFLTASSLQTYLSSTVPKSTHLQPGDVQTPMAWGNQTHEFIVADFTKILADRDAAARIGLGQFKGISMRGSVIEWINKLSGFNRHHRVPDAVNDRTRGFVRSVASDEIQRRVEKLADVLKASFHYKRKDLQVNTDGSIETPDFAIEVEVDIDPDDTAKCIISTSVSDFKDPAIVASEEFAAVFDNEFDRICFSVSGKIDVEAVIDMVEDDPRGLGIDYPSAANSCTITAPGMMPEIKVSSEQVIVQFRSTQVVQALLSGGQSFTTLASHNGGSLGMALRLLD